MIKFDANNKIVQLCAKGMMLEGEGKMGKAGKVFQQAWEEAANDFEKFTSAHYVARHQETVSDKLKWDKIALELAMKIKAEAAYPSLYLNIAKCYEDIGDKKSSRQNYQKALSYTGFLIDDGYGKMIKAGIMSGIERVKSETEDSWPGD